MTNELTLNTRTVPQLELDGNWYDVRTLQEVVRLFENTIYVDFENNLNLPFLESQLDLQWALENTGICRVYEDQTLCAGRKFDLFKRAVEFFTNNSYMQGCPRTWVESV
jgi:hypothetical protein